MHFVPVFLCALLFPLSLAAQVTITEIMYDLETGSDSGREWIEVRNMGAEEVDLGLWRLFEAEVNHHIEAAEEGGATLLRAGGYAIIADNTAKFLADWSAYGGLLFDSAFSLGNVGETLILRDGELADVDSVSYDAAWGANGDSASLQFVGGEWVAAAPTPGMENVTDGTSEENYEEEETTPSAPPVSASALPPPAPSLFTARLATKEKFAVVGAPANFSAALLGVKEGLSGKTRFVWSFGDGARKEGQNILHTYKYPGDYVVVLDAVAGEYTASDRVAIKAIPAELSVSSVGGAGDFYIELENKSAYEINLSGWLLKSGAQYFVIPEQTFILPKKKLIFPQENTRLLSVSGGTVGLLYPNGLTAALLAEEASLPPPSPSVSLSQKASVSAQSERSGSPSAPAALVPVAEEEPPSPVPAPAAVAETLSKENESSLLWLAATLVLVILGAVGVVLSRRGKTPADDFAITEERNDTA